MSQSNLDLGSMHNKNNDLYDGLPTTTTTSTSLACDTSYSNGSVIAYPMPAATASSSSSLPASPHKYSPHPLFPAPRTEPTPPPSPQQVSPSPSVTFKLAPGGLLSRAGSVISKRQSLSSTSTSAGASTPSLDETSAAQRRRKGTRSTAFVNFFTGSSELVSSFALSPAKSGGDTSHSPTRILSGSGGLQRRASLGRGSAGSAITSAAASLFARPGRSGSPSKSLSARSAGRIAEEDSGVEEEEEQEDEILNLDLEDELFRGGSVGGSAEGLSGDEAFDTLFANAERLFMRMLIAYQTKHAALARARAQRREEREAAEEGIERNAHLKRQLDDMSSRVREQDEMLAELAAELGRERALRRKDADRRARSVRVVGADDHDRKQDDGHRGLRDGKEGSEEGGRSSVESCRGESDSGAAIWSRAASLSSASISTMPDEIEEPWFEPGAFGGGLREENMRLKARIAELEDTVDGCLHLVNGL